MLFGLAQLLSLGAVIQFQGGGPNVIEWNLAGSSTLIGDDATINASVPLFAPNIMSLLARVDALEKMQVNQRDRHGRSTRAI